jgi:hypothetical protein
MKKQVLIAFAVGLCITASVMAQVPNYVPTNGLVGYWPFNGNANDESGNGNNGTVNGATLTTDRFGVANKAMQFGQNQYIELANLHQNNINGYSISSWFKRNSSNSNIDGAIVSGSYPGQSPGGLRLNLGAINRFQWQLEDFPGKNGILQLAPGDNTNYCDNNWHFVVATFYSLNGLISSEAFKIYVDGNLVQTISNHTNWPTWDTTTYAPINNGNRNTIIGNQGGTSPNFLNSFMGNLDDIGIWNRALNDCEIQDLYTSQINSVTGSISVSPQPATIGSSVLLSTASQTQNVQWQSNPSNFGWQNVPNNANYSGGTTNSLTVSNVQLSNHNQPFRVIASAGNCTDTSNVATIQIADTCITNVTIYDTLLTTVTDTLIINTTLSLPAPNNENTILIYPNPASDHITIDNGNFAAMAGYSIKIENNVGQQVFQSAINQAQFYVDLSTWTGNGLYFVHLIDPQNNTVTVRKIVLQ